MRHLVWWLIAVAGICAGFAGGWVARGRHTRSLTVVRPDVTESQSPVDCDHETDARWEYVRGFYYKPSKVLYDASWEVCPGDLVVSRVRITDDNQKVYFQYEDAEVLRLEQVHLLGDAAPQVLVLTISGGTNDAIGWHVIDELDGKLREWQKPDYETAGQKLLQQGESTCCKDWNFHLRGNEIFLARGIYASSADGRGPSDGNCCPSRGGILAELKPVEGGFELDSVKRVSRPEYERWVREPFCRQCLLE